MKRPPLYRIKYKFKNGKTAEFFIDQSDPKNPVHRVEWSCKVNKHNISPLYKEYVESCIPYVYQRIANLIGGSIIWTDKRHVMVFKPEINQS